MGLRGKMQGLSPKYCLFPSSGARSPPPLPPSLTWPGLLFQVPSPIRGIFCPVCKRTQEAAIASWNRNGKRMMWGDQCCLGFKTLVNHGWQRRHRSDENKLVIVCICPEATKPSSSWTNINQTTSLAALPFTRLKVCVKELQDLKTKAGWLPRSAQPWLHKVSSQCKTGKGHYESMWDGLTEQAQERVTSLRMKWTFPGVCQNDRDCPELLSQRSDIPCC